MISIDRTTNGKVRVTFAMPAIDRCDSLYLVGWFSEWDESVYRMNRCMDGSWTLTLELEPGCEYHYHFRTPDGKRLNDPALSAAHDPVGTVGNRNSFVISAQALA